MRGNLGLDRAAAAVRYGWRIVVGLGLAGAAIYVATEISDKQGRDDIAYGYGVRMTCEDDPESDLWSGGCDRIAGDIARTDRPSFGELYRAFVTVHHSLIPSPATSRRFANRSCDAGFDADATIKGTRFVLSPEKFEHVCSLKHAQAIMEEIDTRDRALLTIERGGLTYSALAAGALANLTEPLVVLASAFVVAVLWMV